jgi:AcrR family transcriptional regulator
MRADAERNRARVLEAAVAAFAAEGLSVPVAEIARRAGVGTGTVSRHFPTKESLYEAIVLSRVEEIVGHAHELVATRDPGAAFYEFFAYMVEQAAANRALADALSGGGFDIEAAASRAEHDLTGVERGLLTRAQEAGEVRADVTNADVKALIVGCLARERDPADPVARQRMIAIASTGLRADPSRRSAAATAELVKTEARRPRDGR